MKACMAMYGYVWLCMAMYVCMYVCMYLCIYVSMYVCMYVCKYVCMYVSLICFRTKIRMTEWLYHTE